MASISIMPRHVIDNKSVLQVKKPPQVLRGLNVKDYLFRFTSSSSIESVVVIILELA